MFKNFWDWVERHKTFHAGLAALLFITQLAHLYWMFTHIILFRLTGQSYFNPTPLFNTLLAFADYTEIPALITASLLYISQLRQGFPKKSLWFLFLLNSQWLHLFWITDEVVYDQFTGHAAIMIPTWLSWIAIAVDYFEVPIIIDTTKSFLISFKNGKA